MRRGDGLRHPEVEIEATRDRRANLCHERANAVHSPDEAVSLQAPEDVADRRPADAVRGRQVGLGREPIARLIAREQVGQDLAANLDEAWGADGGDPRANRHKS
jgi:hypothetical protein